MISAYNTGNVYTMTADDRLFDDISSIEEFIADNGNINLKEVVETWNSNEELVISRYKNLPKKYMDIYEEEYKISFGRGIYFILFFK